MLMLKSQQAGMKLSVTGLIIRWLFVLFNALMIIWVFSWDKMTTGESILAWSIFLIIWLVGTAIFGFLIKITKPKHVIGCRFDRP